MMWFINVICYAWTAFTIFILAGEGIEGLIWKAQKRKRERNQANVDKLVKGKKQWKK